ncbi:MAG: RrF2 family transcriptional regulator [Bacteroidales bacterium]
MQINTKIRYGLRTMIEIASSPESKGLLQKDIASSQNISLKYLDPIISALKIKGLITNSKGRGSGYILTRPANKITMFDIYTSFEQISIIECINNCDMCERSTHDCHAKNYWVEFKDDFIELLKSKNLAQIVDDTYYECNEKNVKEVNR